jgi:GxxExxY protein
VVEECLILEIKAAQAINPEHESQLTHYLRATSIEVGLLLNFGPKPQFKRLIYSNTRKRTLPRVGPDQSA